MYGSYKYGCQKYKFLHHTLTNPNFNFLSLQSVLRVSQNAIVYPSTFAAVLLQYVTFESTKLHNVTQMICTLLQKFAAF